MIFGQIWTYLGELPEAFAYGSIIYKVVATIFFILTNLAIGTAAIVFYFMTQFLDKNKNHEIYADFRADTLWLLYTHMNILIEVKQFEELNSRLRYDDWDIIPEESDVPILIKVFKNIHSEEHESQFKENLMNYFSNTSDKKLDDIMNEFEKYIDILDKKRIQDTLRVVKI